MRSKYDDESVRRLVLMLEGWAEWQRAYAPNLGYPSRSMGVYGDASTDFDSMCIAVDHNTYSTIDACVHDLPPAQCAAVMKRYGIAAVFRFPRDNYEACLMAAHEALLRSMTRKGVVI